MLAPDFPPGLPWLNTDGPILIADLRGKFVLLDFWTYCCINCMHVIPDLKRLEEKYPELVVIGVHSAKFPNEQKVENIREAILRYDLEHPVVVDNQFLIWKQYGVSAWPSFILIAPDGQVIGSASGEGIFERLDPLLPGLIQEYERRGLLRAERLAFSPLKNTDAASGSFLSFPGKVVADPGSRRLFVSDSNHHRILALSTEGAVLEVIGSGRQGRGDGPFAEATFFRPQGLALDGDHLWIADTENHLIRRADLSSGRVETVAGTGLQGHAGQAGGPGLQQALSSPWDLTVLGEYLYIAMAGTHQIWRLDRRSMATEPWAGSGREGLVDGPLAAAQLAQPSGICSDGQSLYFVDSEASALRVCKGDEVSTLIGTGLFDFGDLDGPFAKARLQHPLGICCQDGAVYIADTYNHRIKRADLLARVVETVAGSGSPGRIDGAAEMAELREPGGLAFLDGSLYLADTNNHRIRVYHPRDGTVLTMPVEGPPPRPVAKKGRQAREKGCTTCGVPGLDTGIFDRALRSRGMK